MKPAKLRLAFLQQVRIRFCKNLRSEEGDTGFIHFQQLCCTSTHLNNNEPIQVTQLSRLFIQIT